MAREVPPPVSTALNLVGGTLEHARRLPAEALRIQIRSVAYAFVLSERLRRAGVEAVQSLPFLGGDDAARPGDGASRNGHGSSTPTVDDVAEVVESRLDEGARAAAETVDRATDVATDAVADAAGAVVAGSDAVEDAVESGAAVARDTVGSAADSAADSARGTADAAAARVGSAADSADEAVEDAAAAVQRAAQDAERTVDAAADEAADAVARTTAQAREEAQAGVAEAEADAEGEGDDRSKDAPTPSQDAGGTPAKVDTAASPIAAARAEQVAARVSTGPAVSADELPVPDFDHMTLGQLRGRLRRLPVEDLVVLRDYERQHGHRLPFLTMLDNRIAKVSSTTEAERSLTSG